jgi:hypothetical protein
MEDTMTNEEKFPMEDWQYDVANGDTKLGYADWVLHNVEAEQWDALNNVESFNK